MSRKANHLQAAMKL